MSITITTNMGLKKPDQNTREPASIFTSFNPNTDLIDSHDHSNGKGVGIKRIQTGTTPAAAGELQVTGDAFRWWGATAGAVRTAQDLESAQTVTGVKTHQAQIVSALGTIAADTPGFVGTATWNNAAVAFTGLRLNVTDASSASGSLLADLQVGGSSKLAVRKDGVLGVAVAPSTWAFDTSGGAIQTAGPAVFHTLAGGRYYSTFGHNVWYSSPSYKYLNSDYAAMLQIGNGSLIYSNAASGTAGATATMTPRLTVDGGGNMGLGVTPSASWWSSVQALQVGVGSFIGYGTNVQLRIGMNTVQTSGGFIAQQTGGASYIEQTANTIAHYFAPSVSASAPQTFTNRWKVDDAGQVTQVHAFANGVTYQTREVSNGSNYYGREKIQRTSVSTSATAIVPIQNSWTATLVLVSGNDGGPNGFTDLLFVCANVSSVTVIGSINSGSPPTRTYAHSAGLNPITLALSSGTYTVTARSSEATGG